MAPVAGRLRTGAHALLGAAMVAMAWPAVPGWMSWAALVPAAAWLLGATVTGRRPADVHHGVMAAAMLWMAAMPMRSASCHGCTGLLAGAAAGYFLLAAAPFLTAPLRRRGPVFAPLCHGAMSLAMAALLVHV